MNTKKATDEMFIRGAVKCVAKGGIENLRTKDVALQTGFSEATLFRFFETKTNLLDSTFLNIDRRLSELIIGDPYFSMTGDEDFESAFRRIWHKLYRWLTDNGEDTIFLIRYRNSSLYRAGIRNRRSLYNGSFDKVHAVLQEKLGGISDDECRFISGCIIEMTLFFVEKILNGDLKDTAETENFVFGAFEGALSGMQKSRKDTE